MLAARMKQARARHGWSQLELAERAGVPQPVISRLENGKQDSMTTDVAKRLARSLGVGIDHLVGTWDYEEEEAATPR